MKRQLTQKYDEVKKQNKLLSLIYTIYMIRE